MKDGLAVENTKISVVGAAAVGDFIFHVDALPKKGEIVQINNYNDKIQFGGCAPNIAIGISALGKVQPVLHYPVGDDYPIYQHVWEQKGVVCDITKGTGKSGVSWMFMQDDGSTMCFAWEGVANTTLWPAGKKLDRLVIICPVLNDYTLGCIKQAIQEKREILVTGIADSKLVPYLPYISCLSINNYEFKTLCANLHIDEDEFCSLYPSMTLIVTKGGNGSKIQNGLMSYEIPVVVPDTIVDYTGAGDAYISGFTSARMAGYDLELSGYVGAATSSFVLEQFGGQEGLPSWSEVVRRIKNQFPAIGRKIREG